MLPEPLCVLDQAGCFLQVNPAFEAKLGYTNEQLAGKRFLDLVHSTELSRATVALLEAERTSVAPFLGRLRGQDGAYRWLEWTPVADAGRCFMLGRESTEQVRLIESETLLATLIDALPDAINFKDGQGRWLLANNAMLRVFGLEGADYKGKRDSELSVYSPFFHECFLYCEETDEAAWLKVGITLAEEAIPQPDGTTRVFESFKVPLFNPDGSRKGLVVIGRDISERRRLEDERTQLVAREQAALTEARLAKEVNELKSNFVNAVSHELRTPLTAIQGYAEFLLDELGGPLAPDQQEYVTQIDRGARRLERLIDDLLDFARMEAGTFRLRCQAASLNTEVCEVIESLQPLAVEGRLSLVPDLASDLPTTQMDPHRIEQVLTNLLSNAIKFSHPGGRIRVRTRTTGNQLLCEVEDAGVGIAPDEMGELFQRFSQLRAGQIKGGGTGLGLSISKSIVEAHGGMIGVSSAPEKGSIFWFSLPVASSSP